jgi:hypothetical protein
MARLTVTKSTGTYSKPAARMHSPTTPSTCSILIASCSIVRPNSSEPNCGPVPGSVTELSVGRELLVAAELSLGAELAWGVALPPHATASRLRTTTLGNQDIPYLPADGISNASDRKTKRSGVESKLKTNGSIASVSACIKVFVGA